jgi:hypothetical protein
MSFLISRWESWMRALRTAGKAAPGRSGSTIEEPPMTTGSSDPARKRYYLVSRDMDPRSAGFSFELDHALIDGRRAGTHEHTIPGRPHPVYLGVPLLREKPRVVVVGRGPTALDYYDFMPVFISTPAKELLERIDPAGFEFAECETVDRRGKPVEPYWWMEVIRLVHEIDEERSEFVRYRDRNPLDPEAQASRAISHLYDIHMPEGFPEEYHAFWLADSRPHFVFDGVLVDAWREAGLTGARFTPLQPPTAAELEHHLRFVNSPYWTNRLRQP